MDPLAGFLRQRQLCAAGVQMQLDFCTRVSPPKETGREPSMILEEMPHQHALRETAARGHPDILARYASRYNLNRVRK